MTILTFDMFKTAIYQTRYEKNHHKQLTNYALPHYYRRIHSSLKLTCTHCGTRRTNKGKSITKPTSSLEKFKTYCWFCYAVSYNGANSSEKTHSLNIYYENKTLLKQNFSTKREYNKLWLNKQR